jgi:hypothetical protein
MEEATMFTMDALTAAHEAAVQMIDASARQRNCS